MALNDPRISIVFLNFGCINILVAVMVEHIVNIATETRVNFAKAILGIQSMQMNAVHNPTAKVRPLAVTAPRATCGMECLHQVERLPSFRWH